jgi:hypothetical protein
MFDDNGLGNYGTEDARTGKSSGDHEEVDEKDHEIAQTLHGSKKPETRGIPGKLAVRHGQVDLEMERAK